MADEKQDGQKTLVAFIVGLLIGGMLVWAFSGPSATAPVSDNESEVAEESDDNDDDSSISQSEDNTNGEGIERPRLEVGSGAVVVNDQPASRFIQLESATYPISEGWIGVRDFTGEQLGNILGVVRFSEAHNIVPSEIILQRSTTAGREYAVVIFTEDGDYDFNLAGDVQIDEIFATFTAQ